MAIGLRHFGVTCAVVERHDSTLDFPRGRGVTLRTMEIFRQWGLEDDVAAAGLPRDKSLFVFAGNSLTATDFTRVGLPPGNDEAVSPTRRLICDQQAMEVVLRRAAIDLGADVRFGTVCDRWSVDDDGVVGELTDTSRNEAAKVRARWMVAADGARSSVRESLGIGRSGPGVVSQSISILFEADLGPRMSDRLSAMYRVADLPGGTVLSVDNDRRWLLVYAHDRAVEAAASFTDDRCVELARTAVRDPAVGVRVVGAKLWESTVLVADRYRSGRLLLAGDAAHVVSPVGGLGMNCGIADAHNLAWKLAGVVAGWAAPALLESYEFERRPVAIDTGAASLGPARVPAPVHGIVLGYRYESPVIVADGSTPPVVADPVNDYVPTGGPGHRAPHLWLDASESSSTLDLFGSAFVMLTSAAGNSVADEIRRTTEATSIPLNHHVVDHARWPEIYDVSSDGGVLIRPDGHVAWRSRHRVAGAGADLRSALLTAAGR
jgi:putative polyketide hydroxylase